MLVFGRRLYVTRHHHQNETTKVAKERFCMYIHCIYTMNEIGKHLHQQKHPYTITHSHIHT